ncbi:DoxX family protein [Pseudomonas nunensis]|uniref:DoxX family protein n=1 Tax=Pseudomonas nunensis TaxID=2961896 RepID=UPI0025B1D769|nr:DoxX family protein [Pseudomonas nunensis]MDN3219682.1 DoxX family protein [Pseudomonas nunensis]
MTNASVPSAATHPHRLHIALWLAQCALAMFYAGTGFMTATQPIGELAAMMQWPDVVPVALVRFIGVAELAGALGLILPSLLRIASRLTPLAATGLVLIQLLAIPFHLSRGEVGVVPLNLVLLALAAFVVWGRWRKMQILKR